METTGGTAMYRVQGLDAIGSQYGDYYTFQEAMVRSKEIKVSNRIITIYPNVAKVEIKEVEE